MANSDLSIVAITAHTDIDADRTIAKVTRRLIPFLIACFFAAYLDRVNVGFAALTMNKELGFSPQTFGWGAGVFFIGYCLFEAPSNYILHRVGARRWIARIMISWGVVSGVTALIWDETSFVSLRLLLGVAEAGFAPGVILYLTYWIPAERRALSLGAFLMAVPLSSAFGAPLSSLALATMDGVANLSGWRWLFVLEAAPSIVLGAIALFYLTDRPKDASWLEPVERNWLQARLDSEQQTLEDPSPWSMLRHPRVIVLGLAYFGVVSSLYGLGFWLPQMVDAFGYGVLASGFIVSIPYACGALAMVLWSQSSDRSGERHLHTAFAALLAACGLAASAFAQSPPAAMAALSVAAIGTLAAMPTLWSLSTGFLSGAGAAVGVALINSIGNLAGFVGPYLVGWIKAATGDFSWALLALAIGPLATAAIVLRLRRQEEGKP
jgi:ACS family tartrate transporter-like MFS transporter